MPVECVGRSGMVDILKVMKERRRSYSGTSGCAVCGASNRAYVRVQNSRKCEDTLSGGMNSFQRRISGYTDSREGK
jgi:hypothetical protein